MIIEAGLWLAVARLVVLLPFGVLARLLESQRLRVSESPSDVRRVSLAIDAGARRMPFRCECLERSIAAKLMLRVRGIPNTLFLGFAKPSVSHAWLQSGSAVVVGGEVGRFAVVVAFQDRGRVRERSASRSWRDPAGTGQEVRMQNAECRIEKSARPSAHRG